MESPSATVPSRRAAPENAERVLRFPKKNLRTAYVRDSILLARGNISHGGASPSQYIANDPFPPPAAAADPSSHEGHHCSSLPTAKYALSSTLPGRP